MANLIPLERKQAVLEDAKQKIMQGATLPQIAQQHKVSLATLNIWLHQLGDDYIELRQAWIDNMLMDAAQAIDHDYSNDGDLVDESSGKLDVARASLRLNQADRRWKKATWYAERRDKRYNPKQEVTLTSDIGTQLDEAYKRLHSHTYISSEDAQVIEAEQGTGTGGGEGGIQVDKDC